MGAYTLIILEDGPLSLDSEELAFFKTQTKIEDKGELEKHIIDVQTAAYKVFPYPCIKTFDFTKLRLSRTPAYPRVLKLAKERKDAILLDIGCCFGTDIRKAVADGWSVDNVVGSDLRREFWDYGHDLFCTTPESFSAAFVAGDAFDPAMISLRPPFRASEPLPPNPDLKSLTSLTPLQGRVSVICASSFFHLFDEGKQFQLAQLLASLLSPLPGSMILGTHAGEPVEGTVFRGKYKVFCHSPESWREMWYSAFGRGTIRVESDLADVHIQRSGQVDLERRHLMIWTVTRL